MIIGGNDYWIIIFKLSILKMSGGLKNKLTNELSSSLLQNVRLLISWCG